MLRVGGPEHALDQQVQGSKGPRSCKVGEAVFDFESSCFDFFVRGFLVQGLEKT